MENTTFDLYPPITMPTSPTWADIETLSLHYPQAHAAVAMVERGEWTKEEALVRLVYGFASAFQQLFQQELERRRMEPPRPFVIPRDDDGQ